MKNLICFLLLISTLQGMSQTTFPFPRTGMKYSEIYYGDNTTNFYPNPVYIEYDKDTSMMGDTYAKFNKLRSYWPDAPFYTRNDSGKIYYFGNGYEFLIYDFTLQVNDTIGFSASMPCLGIGHFSSYIGADLYQLSSITNITLLNNESRRLFTLTYAGDIYYGISRPYADTIRWIEGLGDIDRGLITWCDFEGGNERFVCASDSSGKLWENPNNPGACDSISSCHANFTLVPSGVAQLWYAINQATGSTALTYAWDWGDGATSSGAFPSHTYGSAGNYTICLSISDGSGCIDTFCKTSYIYKSENMVTVNVVQQVPTGIQSIIPNLNFAIFPNPGTDQLNLSIDESLIGAQLNIYGSTGMLVQTETIAGIHPKLSTVSFATGIYTIEVKSKQAVQREKWVKM